MDEGTERADEEAADPEEKPTRSLPIAATFSVRVTLRADEGRMATAPTAAELEGIIEDAVARARPGRFAVAATVMRTDR